MTTATAIATTAAPMLATAMRAPRPMSRSFPPATPASRRWRHSRTIVSTPHTAATCTASTAIAPARPEARDACPWATATSAAKTASSTATAGPSGRAASSAAARSCARATTGTGPNASIAPRCAASGASPCLQPPLRGAQQVVGRLGEDPAPPRARELQRSRELGEVGVDEPVIAHAAPAITASTAAVKPRHSSLRSRSARSPARVIS